MTLLITYPKIEMIETCGGALESIQEHVWFGSLAPHNGKRKYVSPKKNYQFYHIMEKKIIFFNSAPSKALSNFQNLNC